MALQLLIILLQVLKIIDFTLMEYVTVWGLILIQYQENYWILKMDRNMVMKLIVEPGFNSGWKQVIGPISKSNVIEDELVYFPGSNYADPVFSWVPST
jgi:hypothetical protein